MKIKSFLNLLILSSINSTSLIGQISEDNLKGKVKIIKEECYEAEDLFGDINQGNLLWEKEFEFNLMGKITSEKSHYTQNRKWDPVDKTSSCIFEYNDSNNLISETFYEENKLSSKYIYKYNDIGLKSEWSQYSNTGSLKWKTTYEYNAKHKIIRETSYTGNGILEDEVTYIYDQKGNNVQRNNLAMSSGKSKDIMKYNLKYKVVEEKNFYTSYCEFCRLEHHRTYDYDLKGNIIEITDYNIENNKVDSKTTFKFDLNNNLLESNTVKTQSYESEQEKYQYSYDDTKNWIQMIEYKNSIPYHITKRKISYW
jgi:hypothetical protein